jgi:5-methylcytosine-specific restriction endonuclease McrA
MPSTWCLGRRCGKTIPAGQSYCDDCGPKVEAARAQRRAEDEPWAIYHTPEWHRVQPRVLKRDDFQCCYKLEDGTRCQVKEKLSVHHIVALEDGGEPYWMGNLVIRSIHFGVCIAGTTESRS